MRLMGIYGPKPPERSGVASHTRALLPSLQSHFECTLVANSNWQDPNDFDDVLYQIGASGKHHTVFRAMQQRPGPAIIHENNVLSYFYEAWNWLSLDERHRFLQHAGTQLGTVFSDLGAVLESLDNHSQYDRYNADIQVEAMFMDGVSVAFTHSKYIKDRLLGLYPSKPIHIISQLATCLTQTMSIRGRRRLGLTDRDFLFGAFGFIGEYKRTETILTAWENWSTRPDNIYLLIVGQRQYDIEIPSLPGLIYLDFVKSEADFDGYLASVDCGVQLRHPTLGETSGVMTKLLANNKYLITSNTPFTQGYAGLENVYRISPYSQEVEQLIATWQAVMQRPRRPLIYDNEHSAKRYVDQLLQYAYHMAGA